IRHDNGGVLWPSSMLSLNLIYSDSKKTFHTHHTLVTLRIPFKVSTDKPTSFRSVYPNTIGAFPMWALPRARRSATDWSRASAILSLTVCTRLHYTTTGTPQYR